MTLNEFGGDGHGADPDEGGGGGASTPVPHPHHMSHMSAHQCTDSHTYRHNGAGRALYHPGHPGHHHGSGSPFSEALDTFHAEFITQPIDYPLSSVSPPPPLPLAHPQSAGNASDSTGSPVSSSQQQAPPTHPPHPPMSPSLPSFLDTYRHPSGPHEMSPQQVIKFDFTRTANDFIL